MAGTLLAAAACAACWVLPAGGRPAAAFLGVVLAGAAGGRAGAVAGAAAALVLPLPPSLRAGLLVAALVNGELHDQRRRRARALVTRSFTDRLTGLRNYDFF